MVWLLENAGEATYHAFVALDELAERGLVVAEAAALGARRVHTPPRQGKIALLPPGIRPGLPSNASSCLPTRLSMTRPRNAHNNAC